MAIGEATIRQRAITATLKAFLAAGCRVQRVEIDPASGKFVVFTGDAPAPPAGDADLDRELAEFEARRG